MSVIRYSPVMARYATGDWVEYDDYLTLETECNELNEEITRLIELADQYRTERDDLQAKYDRLAERCHENETL